MSGIFKKVDYKILIGLGINQTNSHLMIGFTTQTLRFAGLTKRFSKSKWIAGGPMKLRGRQTNKESYVVQTEIIDGKIVPRVDTGYQNCVNVQQYDSEKHTIGLREGETPIPCSPRLYPITVENPELFSRRHKWCSCGMSKKQVLTIGDSSHSVITAIKEPTSNPSDFTYMMGSKRSNSADANLAAKHHSATLKRVSS